MLAIFVKEINYWFSDSDSFCSRLVVPLCLCKQSKQVAVTVVT